MASKVRIIPRLDIKGPNLVKGVHLEGLRVLGKPEFFAEHYYQSGADELFFQDTVASLYDRNNLKDIISQTAKNIFIPLTVGGGIRTIDDIKAVLRAGADKVSINTAAVKTPNFIKKASLAFGSSTIVIAIEVIKEPDGRYLVYTDNGREYTGIEAEGWAKQAQELGAGEILITSVDNEGTGDGFDMELIKRINSILDIPVIAHGGCSGAQNVVDVIAQTKVEAVAIASVLHYDYISGKEVVGEFHDEGNINFLSGGSTFKKIKPCRLEDIKQALKNNQLPVRI